MTMQTMNRLFSVCAAALLLLTACHAPALEEITPSDTQEPEIVPERTTIPYSLKVGTESTRVTYEGNAYTFHPDDILQVKGLGDRTDIEGELILNGTEWSGTLSYLTDKDAPADDTQLEITLIHAGNADTTTYAKALVGKIPTGAPEGMTLLRHAVEKYSKFTTRVPFGDHAGTLLQQAAFMQFAITFKFDGTHEVGQGGDAKVDLRTSQFEAFADVPFVRVEEDGHDYTVNFIAVVPGGQSLADFSLTVADREISFKNHNTTLTRNTQYTITRDITYGPQLGDPFWSDGTYGRMNHPEGSAQIVGIIVYVNHNFSDPAKKAIDDAITEADGDDFGHGLVMALRNANEGVKWSTTTGQHCTDNYVTTPRGTIAAGNLSGYKNTNRITTTLSETTAASIAKDYDVPVVTEKVVTEDGVTKTKKVTTGWFLPSIGQWMYTISKDGFGGADHMDQWTNNNGKNWLNEGGNLGDLIRVLVMSNDGNPNNLLVKSLNDRLAKLYADFHEDYEFTYDRFGMPPEQQNISDNYWTSSEYNDDKAFRMNLGSVEGRGDHLYSTIKPKPESKTSTNFPFNGNDYPAKVRPFLAF